MGKTEYFAVGRSDDGREMSATPNLVYKVIDVFLVGVLYHELHLGVFKGAFQSLNFIKRTSGVI